MSALWGVIPAAGSGSRLGGELPKQYLEIAGASLLEHGLRVLLDCPHLRGVCIALRAGDERAAALPLCGDPRVWLVAGAEQRAGSVLAGLRGLPREASDGDWVLVHDAARPCLSPRDLRHLVEVVTASGVGGLLAVPVVDTVKRVDAAGRVVATLDRRDLWRAQTPQMFRLGELRAALSASLDRGVELTDEAAAMELAGHPVQVVAGSDGNVKVTVPGDLALAEFHLRRAAAAD